MMVEWGSIFRNTIKSNQQCESITKIYAELDWVIFPHTIVRPDLSIACGPLIENPIYKALTLSSSYHQIAHVIGYEISRDL